MGKDIFSPSVSGSPLQTGAIKKKTQWRQKKGNSAPNKEYGDMHTSSSMYNSCIHLPLSVFVEE